MKVVNLALQVSEDTVMRDIFYDGNAKMEKCAVVLRLAPTWFRIGSFEILAKTQEFTEFNQLLNFVLENNFGHLKEKSQEIRDNREEWILAMYAEIVDETAKMVAKWMSIGRKHRYLKSLFP